MILLALIVALNMSSLALLLLTSYTIFRAYNYQDYPVLVWFAASFIFGFSSTYLYLNYF